MRQGRDNFCGRKTETADHLDRKLFPLKELCLMPYNIFLLKSALLIKISHGSVLSGDFPAT